MWDTCALRKGEGLNCGGQTGGVTGEFGNDVGRIVILGSSGAGKSTLARRVAEAVGGEHVELDVLAFEGRLTPVPFEVFHRRLAAALDVPRWVLEGMHREELRTFALPRCDLVIWLDVSRPRVAVRLVCELAQSLGASTVEVRSRGDISDLLRRICR